MIGKGNINPDMATRRVNLFPLLVANALLLLIPKFALVIFLNQTMWGGISSSALAFVMAQDVLVAMGALMLSAWILRIQSLWRVLIAFSISGALLTLLLMDMRVRELWLKPIDLAMIDYLLKNASGLTSGFSLFFKYTSVYSLTFERFLFYVVSLFAAFWAMIIWLVASNRARTVTVWTRRRVGALLASAMILVAVALAAPQFRYRINENLLIGRLISFVRAPFMRADPEDLNLASKFEQPPSPLKLQLSTSRKILDGVPPFKNVIVIVLESVRWRGLNLLDERSLAPMLSELASTGIVSKCRVAVPHSAKAYYTIFSGRYPFPGIEMREVIPRTNPSIWHYLHDSQQTQIVAISSQNLLFESMGILLKSFGIEAYETRDLPEAKGVVIKTTSSFGASDRSLYPLGGQFIGHLSGRFAGIFFPLAVHYPYDCPATNPARHNLDDYRMCVQDSDKNVSNFLTTLRQLGRLKDTLVVIVGDHGESFGEHGTYVHNSSLYDEEVTVPLVFWSEDGRLGHHVLEDSRQIDIAPTIADLMGALDTNSPVQGVSLLRQEKSQPAFLATFFDGLSAALVELPYKYIYDQSTGRLTTYNLVDDPTERSPLKLDAADQESKILRIRSFLAYQRGSFAQE